MRIPLVDLRAQYDAYKDEFDAALRTCLEATAFVGGKDHEAFAREFADWCGAPAATLVGNGTDALVIALLGVLGQGDHSGEVIVPSHTFIATSEAVTLAGYNPVFADVEPDTGLIDIRDVERRITPATRAIMPVHLYGQMVDMVALSDLAKEHGLAVIEDAAQAHGAERSGIRVGELGDAACFSFYPGKNLGAWGDGGAIISKDANLVKQMQMRANHGRQSKYEHEFEGMNSRLDGLQASILRVKLRHMDDWNAKRMALAQRYDALLADIPGVEPIRRKQDSKHVYHLYVIMVDDRDQVLAALTKAGIGAGIHYPVPLHEQPAYRHMGIAPDALPVVHRMAGRIISLPIYPEMTELQQDYVVNALRSAMPGA